MPKTVVIRLNGALVQVVRSPETAERMAGMGTEPVASTPEEFDKFLKDEVVKWAKLIKEAKIRADF